MSKSNIRSLSSIISNTKLHDVGSAEKSFKQSIEPPVIIEDSTDFLGEEVSTEKSKFSKKMCKFLGNPYEFKTNNGGTTLRMDSKLHEKLKFASMYLGENISQLSCTIMMRWLDDNKAELNDLALKANICRF